MKRTDMNLLRLLALFIVCIAATSACDSTPPNDNVDTLVELKKIESILRIESDSSLPVSERLVTVREVLTGVRGFSVHRDDMAGCVKHEVGDIIEWIIVPNVPYHGFDTLFLDNLVTGKQFVLTPEESGYYILRDSVEAVGEMRYSGAFGIVGEDTYAPYAFNTEVGDTIRSY